MKLLDKIRSVVRGIMHEIAILVDNFSNSFIKPNHVTILSAVSHIVIAAAIILENYPAAALLLVVFGLMDTLDGELARVQGTASDRGTIADAVSDRFKEALIFIAIAYVFAVDQRPELVAVTIAALSASFLTSYTKAKTETILASRAKGTKSGTDVHHALNDGIMRYEIRMAIVVVGLLVARLDIMVIVLAISASLTAIGRFARAWQKI